MANLPICHPCGTGVSRYCQGDLTESPMLRIVTVLISTLNPAPQPLYRALTTQTLN